jgi:ABC-2 type transport system ATP-binding protein
LYSVEVKKLTVKFDDFIAVDDISFFVNKGEIFGFLGANGAGKTTTIRVLCGLLRPTAGNVIVGGMGFDTGEDAIKSKVGYMSQKFTLYDDMTIKENLDFTGSLRKIDRKKLKRRIAELFDFIGFGRSVNEMVKDLPGGIKQQISLVASLLHDPEIIFLDEPTAGVTPLHRARFWDLIRKLSGQGKTVFVTTHYMDEAEECERLALMRTGKIIAIDAPGTLKKRAFPEPLYELSYDEKPAKKDWLDKIKAAPSVLSVQPYGRRYHVSFKDEKTASVTRDWLGKGFAMKKIQPSLEDVFIKLVEGESR